MGTVAQDEVALAAWTRVMAEWSLAALPPLSARVWYWQHDARIAAALAAGYVELVEERSAYEKYGLWRITEAGLTYLRPLVVLLKLRDEK